MKDPKVLKEWIDRVNDEPSKPLTKWEEDFMVSISDQFDRSGRLSEKQAEILERIYSEKTS